MAENGLTEERLRSIIREELSPYASKQQTLSKVVLGNGEPAHGLASRVQSLEQTRDNNNAASRRQVWLIGSVIGGGATIVASLASAAVSVFIGG